MGMRNVYTVWTSAHANLNISMCPATLPKKKRIYLVTLIVIIVIVTVIVIVVITIIIILNQFGSWCPHLGVRTISFRLFAATRAQVRFSGC